MEFGLIWLACCFCWPCGSHRFCNCKYLSESTHTINWPGNNNRQQQRRQLITPCVAHLVACHMCAVALSARHQPAHAMFINNGYCLTDCVAVVSNGQLTTRVCCSQLTSYPSIHLSIFLSLQLYFHLCIHSSVPSPTDQVKMCAA